MIVATCVETDSENFCVRTYEISPLDELLLHASLPGSI
jgi:hypothetical protein